MAPRVDAGSGKGVGGDNEGGLWQPDVSGWGTEGMRDAGQGRGRARHPRRHLRHALDAVWSTVAAIVHRRFSWAEFVEQTWFLISVTVLPTILIAIPFGLVLVLEVGGLAVQIGATSIVGAVDAIGIVREAAPVITAIILSGAGGSAICSDLGARTMRDEISAMWVMAVDPIERLVAPGSWPPSSWPCCSTGSWPSPAS